MFVGRGMRRPSFSGLGAFDPTATGIRLVAHPLCVSPQERDEANSKCASSTLHGMGQLQMTSRSVAPMTGRLAGVSACDVKGLPICPTPKCIDEATADIIMHCMIGGTVAGMDCRDPATAFYLMGLGALPYCSRPSFLPPIPTCVTADVRAANAYCGQYPKSNGPDLLKNAYCWAARHDASYWSALIARPLCRPPAVREVTPRPAAPPPVAVRPPVVQELPPAAPPVRRPPAVTTAPPTTTRPKPSAPAELLHPPPIPEGRGSEAPPEEEAPPEPDHRESSMMGLWGILALLAVGGGGYYMYRKYKR